MPGRIATGQPHAITAAMVDAAYRLFLGRARQVLPGLDLCFLVMDHPKAVGEVFQSTETTPPEDDLKTAAAALFFPGDDDAIADIAAESFRNRLDLLVRLLGHRAFRVLYAS